MSKQLQVKLKAHLPRKQMENNIESNKRKAATAELKTKNSRNTSRHTLAHSILDVLEVMKQSKGSLNFDQCLMMIIMNQQQFAQMIQCCS